MNKRMEKENMVYTMEYHSAIKKDKIMPFAATWMDQEMIIQRNRNIV